MRDFVGWKRLEAVAADVGLRQFDARFGHDIGFDEFAERFADARGGNAFHGGLLDGIQQHDGGFDFRREDVFAADDDHVFLSSFNKREPFRIIACKVASAEKSLAVDVDERFLQLAWLAPIALYDVLSGEQQFADFAWSAFLQIFIDDQRPDKRERLADGIGPFERIFAVENMRRGNGFREAEEIVEVGLREFRLQHADRLDGHEGARVADDAER